MKKILSIMFAFLLIFSCFVVTAYAEDVAIDDDFNIFEAKQPIITFSEDYQKLYVDGESFSRFDASTISADFGYTVLVEYEHNTDYYTGHTAYVKLTDKQKENIVDILIERNEQKNMYRIELYFNDGSNLTVYFLEDSYFDEYNKFINGEIEKYEIDIGYPDGNVVFAEKSALFGETVKFTKNEIVNWWDYFSVFAQNSDHSLVMYTGDLLVIDDSFYYIDYKECGVKDSLYYDELDESEISELVVHKITDEKLLADLQGAMELYYSDDYGVLYDDDATDNISAVFLIFIFAVVPFVILVISLIKAIRSKGTYKKIYGTVTALCIAELIVFIIIAVIVASSNPSSPSVPDYILGESDTEEYMIVDADYSIAEVVMLKEAVYCGDGGCTDGCGTGYFYRGKNCDEEYAMEKLGLGEPDGVSDELFGYKKLYRTSFEENIVVETTEYENGYIVEYQVIGVG